MQQAENLLRRNIYHMFYNSASLSMPSFLAQYYRIDLHLSKQGDWTLRLMTWDERTIPRRSIPWNATRLPSTLHQSFIMKLSDTGQEHWTNVGPRVTRELCKCKGKVIFGKSKVSISLVLSFIHTFNLPFPLHPVLHPHSLSLVTPPFALPQVLNYFQTARRGTAGAQGTIWT